MNTIFFLSCAAGLIPVIYSVVLFIRSGQVDKKYIVEEKQFVISKEVDYKLSLKY